MYYRLLAVLDTDFKSISQSMAIQLVGANTGYMTLMI